MVRYHNSGTQKFDDTEHDSVSTGGLTDTDDGQAWETLREAGFEKGDFLPLLTIDSAGAKTVITSTSYTAVDNVSTTLNLDALSLTNGTVYGRFFGEVIVGTDETVDVRISDVDNGTLLEETGFTTSTTVYSDPVELATQSGIGRFATLEFRTNPGSNSSEIKRSGIQFGVIL